MKLNRIDDTIIHSNTCVEIIKLIEEGVSLPHPMGFDDESHLEWQKKCRDLLKYIKKTRIAQKGYRKQISRTIKKYKKDIANSG